MTIFLQRLRQCAVCALLVGLMNQAVPQGSDATPQQTAFVDALIGRMTLEEKAGQLNQLNQDPGTDDDVRAGRVGSFLWVTDMERMNHLQHIAVDESRLHIPLIFAFDVIHGYHTIFPEPLAMAASFDPEMVERAQRSAAAEARSCGIQWTFAPMLDIARDARWGRIVEGAGEDPYLGAAMARAQIRGFQGSHLGEENHLVATAKHFAGYGAADGGRDYDSSFIPESTLRNVYLPPFKAAVDAGVGSVMSAYMDVNDVPATGNAFLLREVLRKEWGFNGLVISDWHAIPDLQTHGFAADSADAARRALLAGGEMDMMGKSFVLELPKLVRSGAVPESMLDAAVRHLLLLKVKMGLFSSPYTLVKPNPASATPTGLADAKAAAGETAVLLRNEERTLPLKRGASIALIGALADSKPDTLGSWAFVADVPSTITIREGLVRKLGPQARINFVPIQPLPYDPFKEKIVDATDAEIQRAVEAACSSDVVIAVMGESAKMSGENASRTSLDLPGRQTDILKALAATGKPVVLILMNGRPLSFHWAAEHVPAILETWFMGSAAGDAIADLLFGDANPSGKLPVTFPRTVGQEPLYYAHNRTHVPEDAGDFISRYWDSPSTPQYPFGYGLSYTTFALSNLEVSTRTIAAGEKQHVSVTLQNTGDRTGAEVVQLYIHQGAGSASRPVRELKGFQRVTLAAHESKRLQFELGPDELSHWIDGQTMEEGGPYDIYVGQSSTGGLHETFSIVALPQR